MKSSAFSPGQSFSAGSCSTTCTTQATVLAPATVSQVARVPMFSA